MSLNGIYRSLPASTVCVDSTCELCARFHAWLNEQIKALNTKFQAKPLLQTTKLRFFPVEKTESFFSAIDFLN